ncbi:HCN2, partial [Symbiodinium microadriaticum]
VENQKILSILNRHPVERTNFLKLVEEHLDKLAAPRVIYHKLFADFSQQFRTLIGVNCERSTCAGGKRSGVSSFLAT